MSRFFRFVAAVAGFPTVWALCRTFIDLVRMSSADSDGFFSSNSISLLAGVASFLVLWRVLPDMTRLYVLGHELTHALWGMAFGARVSNLKVRSTGGSVTLTKSNVWITLAPYFFPFWTATVALAALAVRVVMHFTCPNAPFPFQWFWMYAVGFTWSFHACFTIRSLLETQPDVQEYGRIFSWTLILVCNLVGILVWIVCTTDIAPTDAVRIFIAHVASAYLSTLQFLKEMTGVAVEGVAACVKAFM